MDKVGSMKEQMLITKTAYMMTDSMKELGKANFVEALTDGCVQSGIVGLTEGSELNRSARILTYVTKKDNPFNREARKLITTSIVPALWIPNEAMEDTGLNGILYDVATSIEQLLRKYFNWDKELRDKVIARTLLKRLMNNTYLLSDDDRYWFVAKSKEMRFSADYPKYPVVECGDINDIIATALLASISDSVSRREREVIQVWLGGILRLNSRLQYTGVFVWLIRMNRESTDNAYERNKDLLIHKFG